MATLSNHLSQLLQSSVQQLMGKGHGTTTPVATTASANAQAKAWAQQLAQQQAMAQAQMQQNMQQAVWTTQIAQAPWPYEPSTPPPDPKEVKAREDREYDRMAKILLDAQGWK